MKTQSVIEVKSSLTTMEVLQKGIPNIVIVLTFFSLFLWWALSQPKAELTEEEEEIHRIM
jgi:hypothetical protein